MIRRIHTAGEVASAAVYSSCLGYRYLLTRRWAPGALLAWVMLNPSTATEAANDPTIERCQRRTREMGFGGLVIANLFALRATDPAALYRHPDPVGRDNDGVLRTAMAEAALVVCGWGNHGAHLGRGAAVEALLRAAGVRLARLGATRSDAPRHPLYVAYACRPQPWPAQAAACATST